MPTAMSHTRQRGRRKQPHLQLIGLRINAGLSPAELAARIGVSRETIRLVEDGFVPGPRIQFAIAAEFNRLPLDLWPIERQRAGR
jgi:DNA-binding XRE family transcriptional regulator